MSRQTSCVGKQGGVLDKGSSRKIVDKLPHVRILSFVNGRCEILLVHARHGCCCSQEAPGAGPLVATRLRRCLQPAMPQCNVMVLLQVRAGCCLTEPESRLLSTAMPTPLQSTSCCPAFYATVVSVPQCGRCSGRMMNLF